ncbi:MAG: ATP-dependent helicase, partial [Anaerolineales bacterium]
GKTRTLTNRITNLINHGVPGGRILALAFNRKAMQEMNERLAARGVTGVNVRTFHSFGYEIARQAGWHYDEATRQTTLRQLLRQAVERHATLPAHGKDPLAPYLAALRRAKLELPPLAEITVRQDGKRVPFAPIFETFLGLQTRRRALNFTDMIYQAIRALLDDDALRDAVQNQFEYVLVDEFQDLNKAQMLLLQILALPENNLFVVGDDDQMIYGWRGAEVRHILDFPKRYPTAETVILGINYRSARKIVNHSRWLIGHNPERVGKNIQARQPAPSEGTGRGLLDIRLHDGVREQATGAAAWIASQKEAHGLEWDDFAVLYRANDDARNVIPALEKQGIPYAHAEESSLNGEDLPDGEDPPDGEGLPDTPQPGAVSLMSVHKAKGKEFPYVVYFNLSRGTAMVETRAPEERRVAYVGVTRAQRGLLITADRGWPSPFVKELAINPEFDDFARVYLERQAAIARKNRDRIAKTIKTRERKRDALLRKFPELTGGPAPAGWRRKRRAAAAARTIQKLGAEIEDRQAKFPLALDRLDAIETEIRFRKLLGVKDKI